MATSNYIDLTEEINNNLSVVLDVSGHISGVIYIWDINPTSTINFYTSNDGGEEEGTVIGGPLTAANFKPCLFTNLSNGNVDVNTGGDSSGMYKFEKISKYLKVEIGGLVPSPIGTLIIQLFKII